MDELEFTRSQLKRRLFALRRELVYWRRLSKKRITVDDRFWGNNSQIRSFVALIYSVHRQIERSLRHTDFDLEEARALSKAVLGLFRIWEFLRSKLSQRLDSRLLEHLRVADGLAWECYEPAALKAYKEPPLVFLNGGFSPFILPRHGRFSAEFVPRELIQEDALVDATSSLPFPVIGIPWFQTVAPWELPVIGHEVGHTIEADLRLNLSAIIGECVADAERRKWWQGWASEIFADYYGTLATGPAFVATLAEFLAGTDPTFEDSNYPPVGLRFAFNLALIETTFKADAEHLRQRWSSWFPPSESRSDAKDDFGAIANKLVSLNLGLKPFSTNEHNQAKQLANDVRDREKINSKKPLRVVVAATRIAWDTTVQNPMKKNDVTPDWLASFRTLLTNSVQVDTRGNVPVVDRVSGHATGPQWQSARAGRSQKWLNQFSPLLRISARQR